MRPLLLVILICLAPLIVCAEEPDATSGASPEYSEETSIEQIRQELEQVKQQLKSIGETQEELEVERQKLGRIIIDNNELSTLKAMRKIGVACEFFRTNQELKTYPKRFKELKDYISEDIINATGSSCALYGYYYRYTYINKDRFKLKAIPATKGKTGERTFVLDNTGIIIDKETGKPVSSKKEEE